VGVQGLHLGAPATCVGKSWGVGAVLLHGAHSMGEGVAVAGRGTRLTSVSHNSARGMRVSRRTVADEAAPPSKEERRESECVWVARCGADRWSPPGRERTRTHARAGWLGCVGLKAKEGATGLL
jgi:hypothetical protein